MPAVVPPPAHQAVVDQLVLDHRWLAHHLAPKLANWSRNHVPPDDLVGEALLALVAAARSFEPGRGAKFSSYAYTCIKWALIRRIRSWRVLYPLPASDDGTSLDPPAPPTVDPAARLEVQRLLRHLRLKDRAVVELYFGLTGDRRGLTLDEIGQQCGVTRSRVGQRLVRALRRMKRHAGVSPEAEDDSPEPSGVIVPELAAV